MTDRALDGARNVDFEYYGSLSLAVPNPLTDIGISYYWLFSYWIPARWYDYQNVSVEIAVHNTPFTIAGGAGFTGADDEGVNQYTII